MVSCYMYLMTVNPYSSFFLKKIKIFLNILIFIVFSSIFLSTSLFGEDKSNNSEPKAEKWNTSIKYLLYDTDTVLNDGSHLMSLETPYRAADAAIVPIKVNFNFNQTTSQHIKSLVIVIDENPSPIVGKFFFSTKSGSPDIGTRIRIDRYTYVRAIAEMQDGKLYMVSNYVKAAGGCSAPSLADMDTVMARLGKMKLKLIETGGVGELNKAQFIISHPNFSGLQFNQLTRTEIPAHFVDRVRIFQDKEIILDVSSDISLSEDPSFTFHYYNSGGPIVVKVSDSTGKEYSKKWNLNQIISKN